MLRNHMQTAVANSCVVGGYVWVTPLQNTVECGGARFIAL
jgi:hypothetical protein